MSRGKGEGSVFWSPRKQRYVAILELSPRNGKRRRKRIERATKAAALSALRDARDARATIADEISLSRFLDDWLASPDVSKLRQSTRQSYRDTLRLHVRPFLGDLPLAKLTPARLDDWLGELQASKRTIPTVRYAKIVLRIALQRAVRRDVLKVNPLGVLTVKGGTKRAPQALGATMIAALLDASTPWMRVAILVGSLCGLRRGEVCGLQWDDLDWMAASLKVERSISPVSGESEPKTASGRRTVQLPAFVVQALEGHRRRLEFAALTYNRKRSVPIWIFPSEKGTAKHPRNFSHAYERARTAAGFPQVRFHDLRHTCATALLELGHDVKAVSQMLGHADVRTTLAMYHHPHTALQRKGAQALQRWLKDAGPLD